MDQWQKSSTHADLCNFLLAISDAVADTKISADFPRSEAVCAIVTMLKALGDMVNEFPPIQQSMRFGNKAFASWHAKLQEEAAGLLAEMLPKDPAVQEAVVELVPYLLDSFGNATRIDYGTGHEANFMAFLLCLQKLGVIGEADMTALGLFVFVECDLLSSLYL
eukprot:TRINITY_DN11119_c0_g3_i4.p1 TRINITY_DN11119_c0_g3~~TRINITY_DN11119_c0_g3_i4.p1  ORF type:complete len:164 (+),score=49.67 TRINITY_DN11119_c0_g3_i4:222-713(+)